MPNSRSFCHHIRVSFRLVSSCTFRLIVLILTVGLHIVMIAMCAGLLVLFVFSLFPRMMSFLIAMIFRFLLLLLHLFVFLLVMTLVFLLVVIIVFVLTVLLMFPFVFIIVFLLAVVLPESQSCYLEHPGVLELLHLGHVRQPDLRVSLSLLPRQPAGGVVPKQRHAGECRRLRFGQNWEIKR